MTIEHGHSHWIMKDLGIMKFIYIILSFKMNLKAKSNEETPPHPLELQEPPDPPYPQGLPNPPEHP